MPEDSSIDQPEQRETQPEEKQIEGPGQAEGPLEAAVQNPDESDSQDVQLKVIEEPELSPPSRQRRYIFRFRFDHTRLLRWAPWALGAVSVAVLVVIASTTPGWGTIATRDGIALLLVGACAGGLILLFRILQQHWVRRRWPVIAAALLLFGLLGVILAPAIHTAQAHLLEHQGNYQRAIDEYSASGEHSPNGEDIARCYLEWGQQDLNHHNYAMAVQHLGIATQDYGATQSARQAREPMGKALLLWGRELAQEEQYAEAIQQFERLRQDFADTSAEQQAQAAENEPAAYYAWGQMLQADLDFQAALQRYQTIGKLFPNSSYAKPAANAAASDLYFWGQSLIQQGKYKDAIAAYQQLIKQYANSPEAQQAQQDLMAPQQVTGRLIFSSGPPDAHVIIRLSSRWITGPNGYLQGGYVYEAHTDANGNFIFSAVLPGMYLIDWQEGNGFTTLLHPGTYNPAYIADVEPLHSANIGDIQVQG